MIWLKLAERVLFVSIQLLRTDRTAAVSMFIWNACKQNNMIYYLHECIHRHTHPISRHHTRSRMCLLHEEFPQAAGAEVAARLCVGRHGGSICLVADYSCNRRVVTARKVRVCSGGGGHCGGHGLFAAARCRHSASAH